MTSVYVMLWRLSRQPREHVQSGQFSVPALESWSPPPKYKCEAPIIGSLRVEPPAGSRDRAPDQGGAKPPEAETLGFWTFTESCKFAHFKNNLKHQKIWYNLCYLFLKKWRL